MRDAVESVLQQTLTDWELIVVADGCSDDLTDLEHRDDRIRVIRQPRRGVSVARNVAIRWCRSDLIALLDDDDRMLPERLDRQLTAMEADRGAGVCYTDCRVVDEHGRQLGVHEPGPGQYAELLRCELMIVTPTIMLRRGLAIEVGLFDSLLRIGEDVELVARIARESRLCYLPEILTEYRRHPANTTNDPADFGIAMKRMIGKHRDAGLAWHDAEHTADAAAGLEHLRRRERSKKWAALGTEWHGLRARVSVHDLPDRLRRERWGVVRLATRRVAAASHAIIVAIVGSAMPPW